MVAGEVGQNRLSDEGRLSALADLHLDNRPDVAFDRIARLVKARLNVPVALVSLVDDHRQFFPGAVGLEPPWDVERETPLTHSFCQHVVLSGEPLVVTDATTDERVIDNLAIPDLGVIAYAGIPLTSSGGEVLGSLCAIDVVPRRWTDDELTGLAELAAVCTSELRLRAALTAAHDAKVQTEQASARLAVLAEVGRVASSSLDVTEVVRRLGPLIVPRLADLASLYLPEGGGLRRAVVVDAAERAEYESVFLAAALVPLEGDSPVARAFRDGRITHTASAPASLEEGSPERAAAEALGMGAAIYVPLVVLGEVIGVLGLGRRTGRTAFTRDDVELAGLVAERTAASVANARAYGHQRDIAETLQRSFLTRLPEPDHLEIVARYRPAAETEQVGGDWYDAFLQPDGATVVVIGDVVGHDMGAAASMGQLRNILRGTAYDRQDPPAMVLARVDRAMRGLELEAMATVLVARLEQTPEQRAAGVRLLRWASAGHFPPVVLHADGSLQTFDAAGGDLLLGLDPRAERRDLTIELDTGSSVLLHTDGLVERRGVLIDDGLAALHAAVAAHTDLPLSELCDVVLTTLLPERGEDDVALLAFRLHDESEPRPPEAGPASFPKDRP